MRLKAPVKDTAGRIVDPGDMLIFPAGAAPIHGRQILYFRDPVFARRATVPPPPIPSRTTVPPFELA